jgi:hypothetical protein
MRKRDLLTKLRFGARVAEEEADDLERYFVETDQWSRLFNGEIDIIYGAKGSGKSAIYALLNRRADELFNKDILIISAENPRGTTVFSDLISDPPTSEHVFIVLWKLYFIVLVGQKMREFDLIGRNGRAVVRVLEESGLLVPTASLSTLFKSVVRYIKDWLNRDVESIEHAVSYDPATGVPTIVRKTTLRARSEERRISDIPVDDLLRDANTALAGATYKIWIVIDRLDVAFVESRELELNALRALFRAYNDMSAHSHIDLKIFVRNDLWRRITEGGFSEASHITRTVDIVWDAKGLLNLIIRRLLNNAEILEHYKINKGLVLSDFTSQEQLLKKVFPIR